MSQRRRKGPSDPAAIRERAALERGRRLAAERAKRKDPANWGISWEHLELEAANDVSRRVDSSRHKRVRWARRDDAFEALFGAGGLDEAQHRASERYFRLWVRAFGGREPTPGEKDQARVDGGSGEPDDFIVGRVTALQALAIVHANVGAYTAGLLQALVEPYATRGQPKPWREVVERVTGETERHAQAAAVRAACNSLITAIETLDRRLAELKHAEAAINDNGGQDAA